MVSLPFLSLDAFEPIGSFFGEWWAVVLGLCAVSTMAIAQPGGVAAPPRVVLIPFALAALIVLHIAMGWVAHDRLARLARLYLLWAGALMWCARALVDARGLESLATMIAWCITGGALASAGAAMVQAHGLVPWFGGMIIPGYGGRAYGNLAQANHLADYLALGLVAGAYLHTSGRLHMPLLAATYLILLYGLVLSGSRSSWLYVVFILAGAALVARHLEVRPARRLLNAAVLACGAFVIMQIVLTLGGWPIDPAAVTTAQRLSVGGEERWTIWVGALRMFADAPWTGAGFGRFAARFFEIAAGLDPPRPSEVTNHAHNLLLEVAVEFGLPGLTVLGAGIVLWWRGARGAGVSAERLFLYGCSGSSGFTACSNTPCGMPIFSASPPLHLVRPTRLA